MVDLAVIPPEARDDVDQWLSPLPPDTTITEEDFLAIAIEDLDAAGAVHRPYLSALGTRTRTDASRVADKPALDVDETFRPTIDPQSRAIARSLRGSSMQDIGSRLHDASFHDPSSVHARRRQEALALRFRHSAGSSRPIDTADADKEHWGDAAMDLAALDAEIAREEEKELEEQRVAAAAQRQVEQLTTVSSPLSLSALAAM
jgi:hypothetical protein